MPTNISLPSKLLNSADVESKAHIQISINHSLHYFVNFQCCLPSIYSYYPITALQPYQSTYNNVCKQYVYVCIYGNGMYLLLQWWLQVLTYIIILDY